MHIILELPVTIHFFEQIEGQITRKTFKTLYSHEFSLKKSGLSSCTLQNIAQRSDILKAIFIVVVLVST